MLASSKRLSRDESGNTAIFTALAMMPILLLGGLAVDGRMAMDRKTEAQRKLDAAVLSAARDLQLGEPERAARNTLEHMMRDLTGDNRRGISCTQSSARFTPASNDVLASYDCAQATTLSAIMGREAVPFTVLAQARAMSGGNSCVLALGGDGITTGISSGGNAQLNFEGCSLASNVVSPTSFRVFGASRLTADCVLAAGGISGAITTKGCEAPRPNASPISDPYANLKVPDEVSSMPCQSPVRVNNNTTRLPPGRYCSRVRENRTVELEEDGVYFFDGANLELQSAHVRLTGKNVTLVFLNGAGMSNNNTGVIDISAPSTGPWAGIAIYADRETTPKGMNFRVNGNNVSKITGAVYTPTADLTFNGGSSLSGGCTQIIARSISFSGATRIFSECENTGVRSFGDDGLIHLVR